MSDAGLDDASGWRIEVKERKSGVSKGGFDYVSIMHCQRISLQLMAFVSSPCSITLTHKTGGIDPSER